MNVEVFLQNDLALASPKQNKFQGWTNITLAHVPNVVSEKTNELCIRIVDEKESAHLNETFRGKKGPTNVLSFSYPNNEKNQSLGDLAICADIVEQEANLKQINIEAHWAHITIHGILHLLGYDHEHEKDAKKMENLEIQILKKLGFSNPYKEEELLSHDE